MRDPVGYADDDVIDVPPIKIGDLFYLSSKLVKLYTKNHGFVHRIQKYHCHQFFIKHFYSKSMKNWRFSTLNLLQPTVEPDQADPFSAGLL